MGGSERCRGRLRHGLGGQRLWSHGLGGQGWRLRLRLRRRLLLRGHCGYLWPDHVRSSRVAHGPGVGWQRLVGHSHGLLGHVRGHLRMGLWDSLRVRLALRWQGSGVHGRLGRH